MIILHIGNITLDKCSGVNVIVPQHIIYQQNLCDVAFLNINNQKVYGIKKQFAYDSSFSIDKLPAPFNFPDLVVFHEIYRPQYLKIYKELLKKNIKYIIFPHGGLTKTAQSKKKLKKLIANQLFFYNFFKHASAIQCLSKKECMQTSNQYLKFIGTNGVKLQSYKEKRKSMTKVNFSFIGRFEIYIKGLDLLIEALTILKDKNELKEKFLITLYGPDENGSHKKMNELISKNNLEEYIKVSKPIFDEAKKNILDQTDIYIQVSRTEGMSGSILEALANGVPCLITEGTGMKEYIEKYDAGWASMTSAIDIANKIAESIYDQERSIKGMNAQKLIAENFDWDIITKQNIEQYQKILEM